VVVLYCLEYVPCGIAAPRCHAIYHQQRELRRTEHVFGHTAHAQALQAATPMRRHRDQIAVSGEALPLGFLALFGGANERLGYIFAKRNRGSQHNPWLFSQHCIRLYHIIQAGGRSLTFVLYPCEGSGIATLYEDAGEGYEQRRCLSSSWMKQPLHR